MTVIHWATNDSGPMISPNGALSGRKIIDTQPLGSLSKPLWVFSTVSRHNDAAGATGEWKLLPPSTLHLQPCTLLRALSPGGQARGDTALSPSKSAVKAVMAARQSGTCYMRQAAVAAQRHHFSLSPPRLDFHDSSRLWEKSTEHRIRTSPTVLVAALTTKGLVP